MADTDWGKRSAAYDPWASLGMADADWGWKKRSGDDTNGNNDDEGDNNGDLNGVKQSYLALIYGRINLLYVSNL